MPQTKSTHQASISIRDMVYTVYHGGDLNYQTSTYGRGKAVLGIEIHQDIQESRPDEYQAEYSVETTIQTENLEVKVRGRADGFIRSEDATYVEEIKSHGALFKDIKLSKHRINLAQLKMYGYLIALEENLQEVELRLTYVHMFTLEEKLLNRTYALSDLKSFWDQTTRLFLEKAIKRINRIESRNEELKQLEFPLGKFRSGQRKMAGDVYTQIQRKGNLFIQAPTGIGKTIGNLFPALKAIGQNKVDNIFFLTAKNTGKEVAEIALKSCQKSSVSLRSIEITAKSKACFNPDLACDPDECTFAKNYFDKVKRASTEAFDIPHLNQEKIAEIALKHELCPFEFSLDQMSERDVTICDYNYAFDPKVQLKRSFDNENEKTLLLIDEAHNLVSRARDMFSAKIDYDVFKDAESKWKDEDEKLRKGMASVKRQINALKKQIPENSYDCHQKEAPDKLVSSLFSLQGRIERWLDENPDHFYRTELQDLYFYISDFTRISDMYSESYVTLLQISKGALSVKLVCLDVAPYLKNTFDNVGSSILFSATLTPLEFYSKSLFGEAETPYSNFGSPFPSENLKVIVNSIVSTKYKDREKSIEQVCKSIRAMIQSRVGNYLVFCPSYAYMELIKEELEIQTGVEIILQQKGMTEEERLEFLAQFTEQSETIGLAVSGGIFGEGIDLKGTRLIGAAIVGVAMPALSSENNLLSAHFDQKENRGFQFAYQYPGINLILQNAGRVIRTKNDKGVLLFLDTRYNSHEYLQHFPSNWNVNFMSDPFQIQESLQEFWSE